MNEYIYWVGSLSPCPKGLMYSPLPTECKGTRKC
nr:MAG TPA: hypothetical protein [Caudoviricetes sp.]